MKNYEEKNYGKNDWFLEIHLGSISFKTLKCIDLISLQNLILLDKMFFYKPQFL